MTKNYWIRAARRFGWDHDPLRRRVDRTEAAILAGLVALLVIAGPLLAIFAGRLADVAALRAQRAERGWYQVPATLLQSAGQTIITAGEMDATLVRATWNDRSGRRLTGTVAAPLSARAGQRVEIWLTTAGRQAYPRLNGAGVRDQVIIAAGLTAICWCAVVGLGAAAVRALADRSRMAAWEQEWDATGPRWSHRA